MSITAEEVRRHVHLMWSGVASGWGEHADFIEARGADVTRRLLADSGPGPGERVLELACGTGDVGLAAAGLVAPGEVVVSDVAAEMTAIAARRAEARGLDNVTAQTFGIEAINSGDATFDVVLCREGLMFAVDPSLAVHEIARVLRPGGRVGVAVWGPRAQNPWLGVVFDAVAEQLGRPIPPPGVPGPFALADADELQRLLIDGGFADVTVGELPVPLSAPSFAVWWTRVSALAGPLTTILAGMPEADTRELLARLQDAVRPYATGDGALLFPGLALVASGRRAGDGR